MIILFQDFDVFHSSGNYCCMGTLWLYGDTVAVWGHCDCMGTLWLYGDTVTVWGYCGCMGTLWLYGDTVAVWGHCGCMGTLWLYGDTVAVWGHCGCMGTLWLDHVSCERKKSAGTHCSSIDYGLGTTSDREGIGVKLLCATLSFFLYDVITITVELPGWISSESCFVLN